jgi:hypothetical protein
MRGTQVRNTEFGKGGSARMFKQQAAGPDRPGNTGKDETPSAKAAKGGSKSKVPDHVLSAKGGATGVR